MTPFVVDPGQDDRLAAGVPRLMAALHSRSPVRSDGLPARVGVAVLATLASFDDDAVASAVVSGFATLDGKGRLRITPAGRGIFTGIEVAAADADDGTDDDAPGLLRAVARFGSVAVNVEALARRLGRDDPEGTWRALGRLAKDGTVDRWPDHPEGPAVALTALGADRLGLKITPDGERWIGTGEPDPRERPVFQPFEAFEDGTIPGYDDQADRGAVGGLDALIVAEMTGDQIRARAYEWRGEMESWDDPAPAMRARRSGAADGREVRALMLATAHLRAKERHARVAALKAEQHRRRWDLVRECLDRPTEDTTPRKLPKLQLLVGLRSSWSPLRGPDGNRHHWTPADGPCPGCGGGDLALGVACLICHRSGLDHLLGPVEPTPKREEARSVDLPDSSIPVERHRVAGGTAKVPKAPRPKTPTTASWDRAFAQMEAMRAGRKGRAG